MGSSTRSNIRGAAFSVFLLVGEHQLLPERYLSFQHIVRPDGQFVGHDAQRDQPLGLRSSPGQMGLPEFPRGRIVTNRQSSGLHKGPFEVGIALFGAPASSDRRARLRHPRDHTGIRAELLSTAEPLDLAHLIEDC